jgi:hypothetical protein
MLNTTLSGCHLPASMIDHSLTFSPTVSSLTDFDIQRFNITEAEKQESLDDINLEVSFYCGMLYFIVQIFKGDEEFGDELSTTRVQHIRGDNR